MLRFFRELRPIFGLLSAYRPELNQLLGGRHYPFKVSVTDPMELFSDRNDGPMTIGLDLPSPSKPSSNAEPAIRVEVTVERGGPQFGLRVWTSSGEVPAPHHWTPEGNPYSSNNKLLVDLKPMYEAFAALAATYSFGPTRSPQAFVGGEYDAEGGTQVVGQWHSLKAGTSRQGRRRAATITEQLGEIFGVPNFDLDVAQNGTELIATMGAETYRLTDLGSGLGHFVVALINLAGESSPSWILVDEPENGLHPTLQAAFVRILASYATQGLVFATHSYGLARRISGSIYLVRRQDGASQLRSHSEVKSLTEFLGEVGFSAYHDLGYDGVLLVEGATDVPVFSELLKTLDVDEHIVILPLGGVGALAGGNANQLTELRRLSSRVAAIIDSERTSEGGSLDAQRAAFVEACTKLRIPCKVLDRRAIENYLPAHAITAALGPTYRQLDPYESLSTVQPHWSKGQNWLVAKRMTLADIESTDLGSKLRSVVKALRVT
jgi:hypothetical protein